MESIDSDDSDSVNLEGSGYKVEAIEHMNDVDFMSTYSKESGSEVEYHESVENDDRISDNWDEPNTASITTGYTIGEDTVYHTAEVEAARVQTMFTNLNMYLAQVMTYFGMLAALYACGNDMVRKEIRKGVLNLVDLHQTLFGELSQLGEENKELKVRNQGLEQDNCSWKALFRVEAEKWAPRYRRSIEVIRKMQVQRQEAETVIAKKETEVKQLNHTVLALESKNVNLEKDLAVSQNLVSSLKQEKTTKALGPDLVYIGNIAVAWFKNVFLATAYDIGPRANYLFQLLPNDGSLELVRCFDEILDLFMDPSDDLIRSLQPVFPQYLFPEPRRNLEKLYLDWKPLDGGEAGKDICVPESKLNEVTKDRDVAITQLFEVRTKEAAKQARIYELEEKVYGDTKEKAAPLSRAQQWVQFYRERGIGPDSGKIITTNTPRTGDRADAVIFKQNGHEIDISAEDPET